MAKKDYKLPFQSLQNLYPRELHNPMLDSLLGNLFDRFMTRDESIPLYGYVGKKPVTDSGAPKVPQSTNERDVNALIPVLSFKVGSETVTFTAQDLVRKATVLGVDQDQSNWLSSQGNNYAPPIDLDKFTNFFNYYWVAGALPNQVQLPWNPTLAPEYYAMKRPELSDLDKLNALAASTQNLVLTGTGFYQQTWTVAFTSPTSGTVTANNALGAYGPVIQPFTLTSNEHEIQYTVSNGVDTATLLTFVVKRDPIYDGDGSLIGQESFAAGDEFIIDAPFISNTYGVSFTGSSGVKGKISNVRTLKTYQTVDGVLLEDGDRVLVKDNVTGQNGIYIVQPHNWVRAADFDGATAVPGARVWVREGTVNAGLLFTSATSGAGFTWTGVPSASNTNDWQEGNFWVKSTELDPTIDRSKVLQAVRPIIEYQSGLELNGHVTIDGFPSNTGFQYLQAKSTFNQLPLFNLYRYDGSTSNRVSSLFFYVEDATAAVDTQLQRRVKLQNGDFVFAHGMEDDNGQLLFYKQNSVLRTIWHAGYSAAVLAGQTYGGVGDGSLNVIVTDDSQTQQFWTLTATNSTQFEIKGSKNTVLPSPYDLITVGTPYSNGMFDILITAGGIPFETGDTFTFSIGAPEIARYVYRDTNDQIVDYFGGPANDLNGVGAWQVPRMFYNNLKAENGAEVPEGTIYSHFRGILANQLPGTPEDRAFGGSIKLWSEQTNLLSSLLMQRELTPVSVVDTAQKQYEAGLNTIIDLFVQNVVKYLGEVEVLDNEAELSDFLDYLLAIRANDQDVKTVLFDSTSTVTGFPPTLPMLGAIEAVQPGLVFDNELGVNVLLHHDGHVSPPFFDVLEFRDRILSPGLTVKRSDGSETAAVGSYTVAPPFQPYKGLLWFYPLGNGQSEMRVFNVKSDLSAPAGTPEVGDYWYSRPSNELFVWDGLTWVLEPNQLLPWEPMSFADLANTLTVLLETRLYNACSPIQAQYWTQDSADLAINGELHDDLHRELAQWAAQNGYDPLAPDYVSTDPFTWNYSGLTTAQIAPVVTSTVPARWYKVLQAHQAAVPGVLPTSRPNIEPWKLMGFAAEPAGWSTTHAATVQPEDLSTPGFTDGGPVAAVQRAAYGAPFSGLPVVDGVALVAGDRVLLLGEPPAQNGIWTVSSGAWSRSPVPLNTGVYVTALGGNTYVGTQWYLTATVPTPGLDPVIFDQVRYWKESMWTTIMAARPTLKISVNFFNDQLLPPYVSTVRPESLYALTNNLPPTPAEAYEFGEGSPVETVWVKSIDYRYSLARALFRHDPLDWIHNLWGFEWVSVDGIQYDGMRMSMPNSDKFLLHGDQLQAISRTSPLSVTSITGTADFVLELVHDAYTSAGRQGWSIFHEGVCIAVLEEGVPLSIAGDVTITNLLIEDEGIPFRRNDRFMITGSADGSVLDVQFAGTQYAEFGGFGQSFTQALRAINVDTVSSYAIQAFRAWDVNLGYRAGGLVSTSDLRVYSETDELPSSSYELRIKRSPYAADMWVQALRATVVSIGSSAISPTGAYVATNDASDWTFRLDGYNARHLDIEYYTFDAGDEISFKALSSAHTDLTWYQPTKINGLVKTQLPIIVTGLQNMVDIVFGYVQRLEDLGWSFTDSSFSNIDQETGRTRTWQLDIEKVIDRVYSGIDVNQGVIMNPFMDRVWVERPQGVLSAFRDTAIFDITADPAVFDTIGSKVTMDSLTIMRDGGRSTIWATIPMFSVHAQMDEYEHIFIFNNLSSTSTDSGLIYDPFTGARIITLRFNGRMQATDTLRPEYGGHYLVGDEVKRNLQSSTDMVQGFYDPAKVYDDELSTRHALALLGFSPKQYLEDLDLTNKTQFDFWRGMIQMKGTNASIDAFLNNDRFEDAKLDEYWAYKVAEYGDARSKTFPELKLSVIETMQQFTKLMFDATTIPADFFAFTNIRSDDESRWFSIDDLNGDTNFKASVVGELDDVLAAGQYTLPFIADRLEITGDAVQLNASTIKVNTSGAIKVTGYGASVDRFNPVKLLNYKANELVEEIPFWHPAFGQHTPTALEAVNVISNIDPARYNISTLIDGEDNVNYDPLRIWGSKEVGRIWWDTRKLAYLPYYDVTIFPNVEERLARWGTLTDYASVDVYEWVESSVPPTDYDAQAEIDAGDADLDPYTKADGRVAMASTYKRDRIWMARPIAWSYTSQPSAAAHVGGSFGNTDFDAHLFIDTASGKISIDTGTFAEREITAGMRLGHWQDDEYGTMPLSEYVILDDFSKKRVFNGTEYEAQTVTYGSFNATVDVQFVQYTQRVGPLSFSAEPIEAIQLSDTNGVLTNMYDVYSSLRVTEVDQGYSSVVDVRNDRGMSATPPYHGATFTAYAGQQFTVLVPAFGMQIVVTSNNAGTYSTESIMQAIVMAFGSSLSIFDEVSVREVVPANTILPFELVNNPDDPLFVANDGIGWRTWKVPSQSVLRNDSRLPNSSWKPFTGAWHSYAPGTASIELIQAAEFVYTLNDGTVINPYSSTWTEWQAVEDVIMNNVAEVPGVMTFQVPAGTTIDMVSMYVNGVAQLSGTYSLLGTTLSSPSVAVGAQVYVIVRAHVPTEDELAFDPAIEDDTKIQEQYKIDYPYVELPIRDSDGSITTVKYFFWVRDRSSIARNKKLSVKSIKELLTEGPTNYLTFQNFNGAGTVNDPYNYNAIAIAGLNYIVTQDETFKLRFTRNFTLRDDPHGLDLKDTHTEWMLLRSGQKTRIPEQLWTLLTNTVAGQDENGNIVPSPRRTAYDERNGTDTRFGFNTDQALAPRELVSETLRFTILNTQLVDDSTTVPVPDYIDALDFAQADSWFDTPEHARATMTTIWNEAKVSQINELFFAAVEDICASNYQMTDLFKTSRLSAYSIKVVAQVPIQPSYE